MKNLFFLSIATVFIFSACKKKNDEDQTPPAVGFQWPAGTGEYAPTTVNSTFTFETSNGTPVVIDSFTYTVTKDTTIDGAKYYKLVSNKPTLGPTYYSNYNAGVITNLSLNFEFQGESVGLVKQTVLKENVALNGTWNEAQQISVRGFAVNVAFVYTIAQKDYTKNVLAKDYVAAIHAKQLINLSLPSGFPLPTGVPATTQIDNYFAKGVGLIQRDITGSSLKIKRFNIVK
jgi:hypothetical protein